MRHRETRRKRERVVLRVYKILILLVCLCAAVGGTALSIPGLSSAATIQDDFSTVSGLWNNLGNAARNVDGTVTLTPSAQGQVGTIWLNQNVAPPFTVQFRFQMTNIDASNVGAGADGIVFMFNKLRNTSPINGEQRYDVKTLNSMNLNEPHSFQGVTRKKANPN